MLRIPSSRRITLAGGQEESWDRGQKGYCPTPDEGDDDLTSYRCS